MQVPTGYAHYREQFSPEAWGAVIGEYGAEEFGQMSILILEIEGRLPLRS